MSEYIINTDRAEELCGKTYADYFRERTLTYMGNPVVQEIVRCRDCVHYDAPGEPRVPRCDRTSRIAKPDGFCAWAERNGE